MIFTAMRKFENAEAEKNYICSDEDFNIALQIVKTCIFHSILMYNNLPNQTDSSEFKGGDNKRKFFKELSDKFERKQAVVLGKKYNLSTRSVDSFLKMALGNSIEKLKSGLYQKI
jgi:hypothetical protein